MRRRAVAPQRQTPSWTLPLLIALGLALAGCGGGRDAAPLAPFDPDSVPQAYRGSTAALMWPGATRAFQIRPDGDLYNGEWVVRFNLAADGQPADAPRVIACEERWRPVVHWRRRNGPVRWDFEALALPAPGADDSGLVVSMMVRAINTASAPAQPLLASQSSSERPSGISTA